MVLVVALPDLALTASRVLSRPVSYIVRVDDARELREKCIAYEPDIVVLDWRMGGSKWRAIDEVPAIAHCAGSRPYVIMLLPATCPMTDAEAARKGCYDVVTASDDDFVHELAGAVSSAVRARLRRQTAERLKATRH